MDVHMLVEQGFKYAAQIKRRAQVAIVGLSRPPNLAASIPEPGVGVAGSRRQIAAAVGGMTIRRPLRPRENAAQTEWQSRR